MSIAELRLEVLSIAFGFVLLTVGLAPMLLPALYRSGKDPALVKFGAGTSLYGALTLARLASVRAVAPLPGAAWEYLTAIGMYWQPVLAFLFVEQYWGAGRHAAFRRIWQAHLVFAVCAAVVDLAGGTPARSLTAHVLLTVAWLTIFLLHLVSGRLPRNRGDGAVVAGTATVAAAVVHDVFAEFGVLPWNVGLLPTATLFFVGCMGHSLLLRTFGNERRLATIDTELQAARQFQRSLLPRELPPLPAGACAVRYRPMDAVGGDLYDFFTVGRGRFGVMVADVSGHGIPAALIASMVKTGAVSQAHLLERPAAVLTAMNRQLYGQLDDHFITAIYAFVDMGARCVALANAGHPYPLLMSDGGRTVDEVGPRGAALGLLPDEQYLTTEHTLSAGDRLVLYSDGLVEAAAPDGACFTQQGLRDALLDHARLEPEPWADQLLERLTRWVGKPSLKLEDDLTLVVLDVPQAGHAARPPAGVLIATGSSTTG